MFDLPPKVAPVPFYSQFENITLPGWPGKSCGVTDLAMVINYYKPAASTTPDIVLQEAIDEEAYIEKIGWTYSGLIAVAEKHGLGGLSFDLKNKSTSEAFSTFNAYLKDGPVIASVHYRFDPKSAVPHLVVITGIDGKDVHYNDPAATGGDDVISLNTFLKAWKKRFIVLRPGSSV